MLATAQNSDPMSALHRIQAAGFTLALENGGLAITPASRLTTEQRAFIASNKAALVAALASRVSTEGKPVTAPELVCCFECRHSVLPANTEPRYGWRRCGLDLPDSGGFGQALRRCTEWEQQP